jgi:hypothetical protein
MMAAVALVALGLVYVLPECQRILWLYHHPHAVSMFDASVLHTLLSPGDSYPKYSSARSNRIRVDSTSVPARWLPAGLDFRVDVVLRLTDPTDSIAVYQEQRLSHWVRSGEMGSAGERETATFEVTPPRAGCYRLSVEQEVFDRFGRKSTNALASEIINAK